jgi:hypothetical protein
MMQIISMNKRMILCKHSVSTLVRKMLRRSLRNRKPNKNSSKCSYMRRRKNLTFSKHLKDRHSNSNSSNRMIFKLSRQMVVFSSISNQLSNRMFFLKVSEVYPCTANRSLQTPSTATHHPNNLQTVLGPSISSLYRNPMQGTSNSMMISQMKSVKE